MAESHSSQLRIWEGFLPGPSCAPLAQPAGKPDCTDPAHHAEELAARETLRGPGKQPESAEPFSLQWFLDIEGARHGRQGRWIPRLLEFTKHAGETVLGLGYGLGTDWVQYARNGSSVVACCPASDHLALVRRNFELRGLAGTFVHARPAALPLEAGSIDVACVNGLIHEVADPEAVVQELYRVLKPGGKVLLVAPARLDVDFWYRHCFPLHAWWAAEPPAHPRPGGPWPPPPTRLRFTARSLRLLFSRFGEHRVYKRHLRRSDVPHVWRWVPLPLLERLMGRLLVFKTFKPLRAALPDAAAA